MEGKKRKEKGRTVQRKERREGWIRRGRRWGVVRMEKTGNKERRKAKKRRGMRG